MLCNHPSVYISTRLVEEEDPLTRKPTYLLEMALYCSDCKEHVTFDVPPDYLLNSGQTLRVPFAFKRGQNETRLSNRIRPT